MLRAALDLLPNLATRTPARAVSSRLVAAAGLALTLAVMGANAHPAAAAGVVALGPETYSTRGVVKSFGRDRKYVMIAHDDIKGYMNAMTMSFEPRSPSQLADLAAGDKVRFTFTAGDDGRRLLDVIGKEKEKE
jgi:Cu(I)/Ag(I) efflux system periplasmic protein CusF